ncbi:hypothetical protein GCM10025868_30380 [Angustibacter aerolatus]|uniref:Metal-dependent hydrolase n=1 Tax=Angustibacter aerolatus TaxID=1162965 RepID=A0ABQ6JHV5_9ACTN|nr:metal-dependent hydrolase [Angustibacter aerolatus]GMA87788.1 hypothetical protein GCM10025868_30380 [Angustibacter aerolatus]
MTDHAIDPSDALDDLVLRPRDVRFDWTTLPMHWVPGDPVATHVWNVLHLLLPEGERWFVRTFHEALPLVRDEALREDVLGFVAQESVHADAHGEVLEHLRAHGLDPSPFVAETEQPVPRGAGPEAGADRAAAARAAWSSGWRSWPPSSTSPRSSATGC